MSAASWRARVAGLMLGAATLAPSTVPAHAGTVLAAVPIGRCDLRWWCARHQQILREEKTARPDVVFLGDSITYNWERDGPQDWARYQPDFDSSFGRWHPLNLGFVGDTTASVLWRIGHGELDGIAPRAIVLLIGANNFGRVHWTAEQTETGIAAILAKIRKHLPDAHVLLLGVLPSDRGGWCAAQTAELNRALAEKYGTGEVQGVVFHDPTSLFLHNGALDRTLFYDPLLTPPEPALHPTASAQARLTATIAPILASWMKDAPR